MADPLLLKAADLKLADVVELFEGPFGTGVVRQIRDDVVTISRPHGVTADFSYTGGVLYSTGVEEVVYSVRSDHVFKVWQRKDLK